jgi:hypothetical protein
MLVILTDEQILSPDQVCQGCLMADHHGSPRWRQGKLGCGQSLGRVDRNHPALFQCQMGFKLANIE